MIDRSNQVVNRYLTGDVRSHLRFDSATTTTRREVMTQGTYTNRDYYTPLDYLDHIIGTSSAVSDL
jgi:hypothetical protein